MGRRVPVARSIYTANVYDTAHFERVSRMTMQSERGSALLLTIIVIMILLFLGCSLGLLSVAESRMAQREEARIQAYYLARSGADAVATYIIRNPSRLEELPKGQASVENSDLEYGSFSVTISEHSSGDVVITSIAKVSDVQERVSLTLTKQSTTPSIENAVFVIGNDSKQGRSMALHGVTITGPFATNLTKTDSVFFDWGPVRIYDLVDEKGKTLKEGSLKVGPEADPSDVVTSVEPLETHVQGSLGTLDQWRSYSPPNIPDFSVSSSRKFSSPSEEYTKTNTLPEDNEYDTIDVSQDTTLIIDLNHATREIYVRNLTVGWGHIELINPGRLVLYVENKFSLAGSMNHPFAVGEDPGDPSILTVYYTGSDTFGTGEFKFSGNIFVNNAPVSIGSSSVIFGNILVEGDQSVSISGAGFTNGMLYAPQSTVTLSESGQTGAVVAKELYTSGNVGITYPTTPFTSWLPSNAYSDSPGESAYSKGAWSR